MKLDIDSKTVSIPCPHCSKKFDEKIGRLKQDQKLICPACHESFTVDATKLRAGIEKTLYDFKRQIGKLGR
ncbi:YnfU family zinc-binding protein [Nitrosospira briensis]|uniref:YnfU family zinc-binding protein n=1 Tax=Nitrosospira briensis TaxID=35799 RepID=UPI0038B34214